MILSKLSRQQTSLKECRAIALVGFPSHHYPVLPRTALGAPLLTYRSQGQCLYHPKATRRRLHNVPQLPHDETFTTQGVGRALSPQAYRIAWHEYQSHLVTRLNELTVGMD